jgi:glycosyltransferase involved in cell wall biosynthesis
LPPAKQPVAAFVGLLGWPPNADAATWLAAEIWPRVRRDLPEARLLLVGRDPAPAVRALDGASGIEVTGTVADVQPYLASARVGLAPLRAGGGSRLKILESLDAGRPVVATAKGAEGLEDLVEEGVEIHDDPAAFAASVVRLLSNPDEARRLGEAGHAAVAARHSWAATLDPLIEAIEAGLPGGKP